MLRPIFIICIYCFFCFNSKAQTGVEYGVKGGLNLTFFQITESNFGTNTVTETGFYGGVFSEFIIDDDFSIQPELLYIGLGDFEFLNIPIYAKYEVANRVSILLGPSMNYFFDFFSNKFKVRGDVSMAYDISSALDAHIKYTVGFEIISPNGLFFGLGWKF